MNESMRPQVSMNSLRDDAEIHTVTSCMIASAALMVSTAAAAAAAALAYATIRLHIES